MSGDAPQLEFPCELAVKVLGEDTAAFRELAAAIVRRHAGAAAADAVSTRPSRNGKYVALTFAVYAEKRATMDAMYAELSAADEVLMAL